MEVDVDRTANTVKYSVNGKLQATQISPILGESSRVFMPYLEMLYNDDAVEWLMC